MAYAMLYIDDASIVRTFETRDDATDALNKFVGEHPEVRDDLAVMELDESGRGVGDYVFAHAHSPLFA